MGDIRDLQPVHAAGGVVTNAANFGAFVVICVHKQMNGSLALPTEDG